MNSQSKRAFRRTTAQPLQLSDKAAAETQWGPALQSVPLPAAPKTGSPVPWLTSIHGTPGRGNYGDGSYRGNCSGLLIKDLLEFYRPRRVLDAMTGSGTCHDVCNELGIECVSRDVRQGFDACDPRAFQNLGQFSFIWLHPPYWKLVRWSDDPRCLANAPTLSAFLERLRTVVRNCASALESDGVMAILIGDMTAGGKHLALPFRAMNIAVAEGLELAAPEIIRFSHGATSSKWAYQSSFIPRLHDICLVLRRRQVDRDRWGGAGRQRWGNKR